MSFNIRSDTTFNKNRDCFLKKCEDNIENQISKKFHFWKVSYILRQSKKEKLSFILKWKE